jgi:repressor LexA
MKQELTERQSDILEFIGQYTAANGYPPTLREIGAKFGISSTFGVKRHLDALEKKGFLRIETNASRGITMLGNEQDTPTVDETGRNFRKLPIVGRVAAGTPILASENVEGSMVIDPSFLRNSEEECFALKVKGDSMINAGIFEGDLVIVAPGRNIVNNDIIVGVIEGDATVKRFYREQGRIILYPENDDFSPITITQPEEFHIAGKVVGVIRWFN